MRGLLGIALAMTGCGRSPSSSAEKAAETLLWTIGGPGTPRTPARHLTIGIAGGKNLVAWTEPSPSGKNRIRVSTFLTAGTGAVSQPLSMVLFDGTNPRLSAAPDGTPVIRYRLESPSGAPLQAIRRLAANGTEWTEPTAGLETFTTPSGTIAPAVVKTADGRLVLVERVARELVRRVSMDDGRSWSAGTPLGLATDSLPHTLARIQQGLLLAWTEGPADSNAALPGVWTLRLAVSKDDGATWTRLPPLARAAGEVPVSVSFVSRQDTVIAAFAIESRDGNDALSCSRFDLDRRTAALTAPPLDAPRGRYALDTRLAAAALELWAAHTLDRPEVSKRLFIEGYFLRGLVAAHDVLAPRPGAAPRRRSADTEHGVLQALSFADWMLSGQDADGYWPLGYKAVYIADMAAVVGLFSALEPHAAPATRQHYVAAAARFAHALERDGMLLPNGACGVGWKATRVRSESTAVREPYLVSTALAGIETHAWLYVHTHDEAYRVRALAALDYTLSSLQPDGSFASFVHDGLVEWPFTTAAYVEEAWMAADRDLGKVAHERLKRALRPHVAWLLRNQRPDGTWGNTGVYGEWARTPAILNFLIWYDQRCESRPDVRQAVQRASALLIDPDKWYESGLLRAGLNEEVQRAIVGRVLAALASERPIY